MHIRLLGAKKGVIRTRTLDVSELSRQSHLPQKAEMCTDIVDDIGGVSSSALLPENEKCFDNDKTIKSSTNSNGNGHSPSKSSDHSRYCCDKITVA